ncbi:hypothetical protein LDC_1202 [sediment metagenome]|uniref:Uncharacterized protein n=1 Tax=sediment metagenome TaxID=749907 RepID=D9PI48_9ZZZZ
MGLTSWWRKPETEKDESAECGCRCYFIEDGRRVPYCEKVSSDSQESLKKEYGSSGIKLCPDIDTLSFPVRVGKEKDQKFFYKCSKS